MKLIQIVTLLFFSVCFAQNSNSEDFYSEMGKAQANGVSNSKEQLKSEIADTISTSSKRDMYAPPKDFKPDNGLFFDEELQTTEKQSFTQKNYNVEEATNTSQAENSTNESTSPNNYEETKSLTVIDKFIRIVGLVIGWFVAGFLINFFFYAGKPDYLIGKSETAKNVHIITNIITVILILMTLFSS